MFINNWKLLTVLNHDVKEERLVQMPDEEHPCESNSVLSMERVDFPEEVTEGVLVETSDVLKTSPFLGHVSWLSCCVHELAEITIGFLGQ